MKSSELQHGALWPVSYLLEKQLLLLLAPIVQDESHCDDISPREWLTTEEVKSGCLQSPLLCATISKMISWQAGRGSCWQDVADAAGSSIKCSSYNVDRPSCSPPEVPEAHNMQ